MISPIFLFFNQSLLYIWCMMLYKKFDFFLTTKMSQTHSFMGHLTVSTISQFLWFGRSLGICHLTFDKETISDGLMHILVFRDEG